MRRRERFPLEPTRYRSRLGFVFPQTAIIPAGIISERTRSDYQEGKRQAGMPVPLDWTSKQTAMRTEVENWWKQAAKDFEKAEVLYKSRHFDGTAFFCQQAIEKGLKGLLIQTTESFPKIHDLTRLAKLVEAPEKIRKLCSKINPAYTASRYPDSAEQYSEEDCEKLLTYSKAVLQWIERKLSSFNN